MSENRIRILASITVPTPQEKPHPATCEETPEERVRAAIELVDSGHESEREWNFLRNINNKLMRLRSRNKRQQRILDMIQPVMEKYGQMDPRGIEMDPSQHSSMRSNRED